MNRGNGAALALLGLLLCPLAAHADAVVTADKIISGDEIALTDGRTLRLSGIEAATPEAAAFLKSAVLGRALTLRNATIDRYGRVDAAVYIQGQTQSVEDAMLREGLAFVYPATGDATQLDGMLKAEQAARREKRGYWSDHPDTSSDDAETLYGKYGFVVGVVTKAARVKNKLYLDFGADWRTDFTISIAARDLRAFKKQGLDPLAWQGEKLRVRGWVKRDSGPMIAVTDPHQIEPIP